MKIKKLIFRVIIILVIFYFFFAWFFSVLSRINTMNSKLMCENTLKMIANAAKLYQANSDGQWPPSLLQLGPYYEGKYNPGPNSIPKCPGDRNEKQETSSSSKYYYFQPKVEDVVPVCWDSKPHSFKGAFFPDTYLFNVLYSDGHIDSISEGALFRDLFPLAKNNPDIFNILNYPDKKISYPRLTLFIVGIIIGLILARCYRFVIKRIKQSRK